eukprot:365634-Chlamydomonas_euryale.AAC.20
MGGLCRLHTVWQQSPTDSPQLIQSTIISGLTNAFPRPTRASLLDACHLHIASPSRRHVDQAKLLHVPHLASCGRLCPIGQAAGGGDGRRGGGGGEGLRRTWR